MIATHTARVARAAVVAATLVVVGCSNTPTAPVTVVSAHPSSPASDATVSFYAQPLTLSVNNGGSADSTLAIVDTFQVASDTTFAAPIASIDVAQSNGATTTVTLPALGASATYFWRVRSTAGGVAAPFSSPTSFTIGPRTTVGAPTLVSPLPATFVPLRPTFTVADVARTGPVGSVQYQFDVATDAAFTATVATGVVPETAGQTSFTPSADLSSATIYFWRAHAIDAIDATHQETGAAASGSFATSVSGSAILTLHNTTTCYTFATDIAFSGTATPTATGLGFQTTATDRAPVVTSLPASQNGTIQGDAFGTGNGPMSPGVFPGILVEVKFDPGTTLLSPSFATPGQVTGTLAGAITTWNVFSDGGGRCGLSGFTWTLVPH